MDELRSYFSYLPSKPVKFHLSTFTSSFFIHVKPYASLYGSNYYYKLRPLEIIFFIMYAEKDKF